MSATLINRQNYVNRFYSKYAQYGAVKNPSSRNKTFTVKKEHDGIPLFMALFDLAEQFGKGGLKSAESAVAAVIREYVEDR